jgi:hypothetical protein
MRLREDVIWMSQEQWDWYMKMVGDTLSEVQDPPILIESTPHAEGEQLLWEKWDEAALIGVLEVPPPPFLSDAPPTTTTSTG